MPVGLVLLALGLSACGGDGTRAPMPVTTLFTRMPAAYTGIDFENRLSDTEDFNVFTYRNYFNGGGVGIGDLNGDGLADLYLTANQQPNRLYLNRGGFRFEDVTRRSGAAGTHEWSTGVTFADVNGDGRLDLYVCNAGNHRGDDRANELFLNQGNDADGVPTFREVAEAYGLADEGYSTHAAFLDYDRDGDLDLYLLNNSFRPVSSFGLRNIRHVRDARGGDKLFRNDGKHFTDVSEEAGIYGSEIAFGLGVAVGDVNRDGWPDLYVSNDFFERDYLYLNDGDGTFSETLEDQMPVISLSSMGADLADLTGDGYPEVFVTDMLPESDRRLKTTSAYEGWDVYQAKLRNDYHHQFMRNMLHLNNGDSTFSEVGQLAGVHATDWSWGALIADFDQDGRQDLFVSNGVFQDVTDQDFIDYLANDELVNIASGAREVNYLRLVSKIPAHKLPNYLFAGEGDLQFTNQAAAWGLAEPSFSNGSAYGDLDGDGDLDLVVNNVNQEAFVYRNEADTLRGHRWLRVRLEGEGLNRYGFGAQVTATHGDRLFYLEQFPTRGFQSSVEPVLTFGLGGIEQLDALTVQWPDGRRQTLTDVATGQVLTLRQADAIHSSEEVPLPRARATSRFREATAAAGLDYRHEESDFVDFDRLSLLPRMLSTEGPRLAVADVNGDGLDDVYVGGAKGAAGGLFVQQRSGGFVRTSTATFDADAISEDVGAAFFDAEGDGDLDLYVASGSNEFAATAPALWDRLYLNDGRGGFAKAADRLPLLYDSGSVVAPADYDGDGDLDLFVGSRTVPWRYGFPPEGRLLQNDGQGRFTDVAPQAGLSDLGMVTDAVWIDYDGDGRPDLVAVGDWTAVQILRNRGDGTFENRTEAAGLGRTNGWWNSIVAADYDGDGDPDLVAGNLGLNTRLKASPERPVTMHVKDFDNNGWVEPIVSQYLDDRSYPITLRKEMLGRLSFLKKRYVTHADYAEQTYEDLFTPEERAGALAYAAYEMASVYLENRGDGTFRPRKLPTAAQLAPVYGLLPGDFDGDGRKDLLLAGNFFGFKTDLGRMAASYGLLLRGDGAGGFEPIPAAESGFRVSGQVRDLAFLRTARRDTLVLVVRNGDALQVWQVH